ncbi:MAG: hypothetical protein O9342_11360 [Beijerinckiaceae bacterium]|nr:hypothetical protein [Beijerinckiaceae bacterium]
MSVGAVSVRLVFLAGLGAALAACQSTSSGNEPSPTERRVTERIFFGGTKLPEQKEEVRDLGCPAANILDGTAAYRTGDTTQARGVAYQAAINDLARECRQEGNTMRIKVGIQGRVLLGEAGKPGTYTIPVRIAVRGNGQTLSTRLVPVAVNIPASDNQAPFVTVDDSIAVPITAADPAEQYSVLIGLDPQGARQTGPRRQRRN